MGWFNHQLVNNNFCHPVILLFPPVRLNDSWKKALYDQVNSLGVVEMLGVNCSLLMDNWVVLSNIFCFHTYLGEDFPI